MFTHSALLINGVRVEVVVASAPEDREQGQRFLPWPVTMLFVFPRAERLSFWMKDVSFPLVLALVRNGRVEEVRRLLPYDTRLAVSGGNFQYALEMSEDDAQALQLGVGSFVEPAD